MSVEQQSYSLGAKTGYHASQAVEVPMLFAEGCSDGWSAYEAPTDAEKAKWKAEALGKLQAKNKARSK